MKILRKLNYSRKLYKNRLYKFLHKDMISFIIVNYNSTKELQNCLHDLCQIDNASECEVIIINNDTQKLSLPKYNFQNQILCEINKNIGYGAANNIGLKQVNREFVCFLNPDTHSFCTNLTTIIKHLENKKAIIMPQIRTESGNSEPWSVGSRTSLLQLLGNNIGLYKKPWLSKQKTSVDWVSGAALFTSTKLMRELGGFDEDFFLYFEDMDLCKRASAIGTEMYYVPQFHVTHTGGASSKKSTKKQKKCYYKSQDLFFQKHLGTFQTFLLRTCRFLHIK